MIKFKPNKIGYLLIAIVLTIIAILTIKKRKQIKKTAMKTIHYIQEKTWDIFTDRRIKTLHPQIRNKAKEFINRAKKELGIKLRITAALRTREEQDQLYAQGRTTPGKIITNAKAGQSLHNYGLAIDVVEIKNGNALWNNPNWNKIAALGKSLSFTWGADWKDFKDKPHFQYTFGKTLNQLKTLYTSGNRNGEYVNLA